MRVLIQRVTEASVEIGGEIYARIGAGMLLLVGIEEADGGEDIEWLVGKVARLRIFDDAAGVMNLDVGQIRGEVGSDECGSRSGGVLRPVAPMRSASRTHSSEEEAAKSGGGVLRPVEQMRSASRTHSSEEEAAKSGGGEVLVISQFTLHASTRKGNRPSYIRAARPEVAEPLYRRFVERLERELGGGEIDWGEVYGAENGAENGAGSGAENGAGSGAGARVKTGVFGADMKVGLVNDGPVTILMDSKNRE